MVTGLEPLLRRILQNQVVLLTSIYGDGKSFDVQRAIYSSNRLLGELTGELTGAGSSGGGRGLSDRIFTGGDGGSDRPDGGGQAETQEERMHGPFQQFR